MIAHYFCHEKKNMPLLNTQFWFQCCDVCTLKFSLMIYEHMSIKRLTNCVWPYLNPMALNVRDVTFPALLPLEILGSTWRHFRLSQFGERCYWHLVGRDLGYCQYCQTPYIAEDNIHKNYYLTENVNHAAVEKFCLKRKKKWY